MRRSILIAMLSFAAGLGLASATAWGYAKLNAWRAQGPQFQLGYVVGYLDGVEICKRRDARSMIPSSRRPEFERWRDGVNEYFADPSKADRQVPDAMKWFGDKVQKEQLEAYDRRMRERYEQALRASPSVSANGAPTPAGGGIPSRAATPAGPAPARP